MNLHQRQKHEVDTAQHARQASNPLEFQSAEEMLRHDAAQIEVPESIAGRIAESARATPVSWWRRLFH